MVDLRRLERACHKAREQLLAERGGAAHWTGRLSSSPLATATAVSALVLAEQHAHRLGEDYLAEQLYQGDLSELLVESIHWLARHQNDDGGWGDTDKSLSNIATTMLVRAAFHLTGVPAKYADLLGRADDYIQRQGGVPGLRRRYGRDKTFAVPILANCALAELVPWKEVAALPFELACLPQSWYRFLKLPVVSYAIPALVAIGQAKFHHHKPANPIARLIRRKAWEPSYRVLEQMQPASGGYLEATPLTSFVVMSLAASGRADSPVVRRGVEFLLASVRADGSWPIDTDLATWNTTLAVNALAQTGDGGDLKFPIGNFQFPALLDWLLSCQHTETHPFTGAAPGGWSWTNLSGGVPDVDDTAGALLALKRLRAAGCGLQAGSADAMSHTRQRGLALDSRLSTLDSSARSGVEWLLDLQNADGGWPTFCRGWGKLPFDRSGADLTAHALRALWAWRGEIGGGDGESGREGGGESGREKITPSLSSRIDLAIQSGLRYLLDQQRPDGSWLPLWFGNQFAEDEANPIYGTAKVVLALRDLGHGDSPPARRALEFLARVQQADGGWGGGGAAREKGLSEQASSVEETALAVEALLVRPDDPALQVSLEQGLAWLVEAVEQDRQGESSPIGLYFAKLWYYERLYPHIHTASALGAAVAHQRRHAHQTSSRELEIEDGKF
jgi:squalene-hopene/tetraprenyl-beta-curcumene cyclase